MDSCERLLQDVRNWTILSKCSLTDTKVMSAQCLTCRPISRTCITDLISNQISSINFDENISYLNFKRRIRDQYILECSLSIQSKNYYMYCTYNTKFNLEYEDYLNISNHSIRKKFVLL